MAFRQEVETDITGVSDGDWVVFAGLLQLYTQFLDCTWAKQFESFVGRYPVPGNVYAALLCDNDRK